MMLNQAVEWSERSTWVINHVNYCTGNPSWIPRSLEPSVCQLYWSHRFSICVYVWYIVWRQKMSCWRWAKDPLWQKQHDLGNSLWWFMVILPPSTSWCNAKGILGLELSMMNREQTEDSRRESSWSEGRRQKTNLVLLHLAIWCSSGETLTNLHSSC